MLLHCPLSSSFSNEHLNCSKWETEEEEEEDDGHIVYGYCYAKIAEIADCEFMNLK